MAAYSPSGPVDCSIAPDKSQCKGKSIVVTGGKLPDIPDTVSSMTYQHGMRFCAEKLDVWMACGFPEFNELIMGYRRCWYWQSICQGFR